ncbi:hypothetical protein WI80_33360 [Burkholderia ubonensis]|uniref:hypothetical protein n=1 Tax=Burkholderia ubonensis TaxID=101571 RepID=UPI000754730D|nr:hypothetical protein [Burkholderia ubonensis]KVD19185.1 hypothetical protein WI80_33360 [Burkholderia ubonensis]KVU12664.1 hypothetical protein WK63_19390 [Burkholderia ubonensis]
MKTTQDNRADSTLDQIAAEELAEHEELREQAEAKEQAEQERAFGELVDGWKQAVVTAGDIVTSVWPGAKPVWTDERMTNLGAALARADEVYGWGGAGSLFSHPLVGVAVAGFPLAMGTAQVIRVDAEARKRAKLRDTQAAQATAPVIGDASPDGAAAEFSVGIPPNTRPAEKIKPTPLNPGGLPAFGE